MGELLPWSARRRPRDPCATRCAAAESTLADLIAANSKLKSGHGNELRALTERSGRGPDALRLGTLGLLDPARPGTGSAGEPHDLLPPAPVSNGLASGGKVQAETDPALSGSAQGAARAGVASNRLEQIDWPVTTGRAFRLPLKRLSDQLSTRLAGQLRPHLRTSLEEAGFNPANHREQVAAHKMREELLDVIQRRRHLKFTDVRDIVARNILRLPDPTLEEIRHGDRLAHSIESPPRRCPASTSRASSISRVAATRCPAVRHAAGRLILRHLIVPAGLAFLGLKTLDILVGLIAARWVASQFGAALAGALLALLINAFAYTRSGVRSPRPSGASICWTVRLLLFDGMRRLLRWGAGRPALVDEPDPRLGSQSRPAAVHRRADRAALRRNRPADRRQDIEIRGSWLIPAFAIGTLARNTPAGRRMLDNAASATRQMLRRLNQTLVIGLVRELLHFFKEVTRRFEQGLHRIEELLSHQLGESRLAGLSSRVPVRALSGNSRSPFIQFYVTVLVEPQINPIKHFPLVTIAHKLMLPFLPALTGSWLPHGALSAEADRLSLRDRDHPLLPGLAGFLVWELKENWKIYAANHAGRASGRYRRPSDRGGAPIRSAEHPDRAGRDRQPRRDHARHAPSGFSQRDTAEGVRPAQAHAARGDPRRGPLPPSTARGATPPRRGRSRALRLLRSGAGLCLAPPLRRARLRPGPRRDRTAAAVEQLLRSDLELYAADTADDRPIELRLCVYLGGARSLPEGRGQGTRRRSSASPAGG
jgi:hypothetical protein